MFACFYGNLEYSIISCKTPEGLQPAAPFTGLPATPFTGKPCKGKGLPCKPCKGKGLGIPLQGCKPLEQTSRGCNKGGNILSRFSS